MSEITVRLDYCLDHPGELHMIDERGRHVANDMKSLERRGYRYIRHAGHCWFVYRENCRPSSRLYWQQPLNEPEPPEHDIHVIEPDPDF
jgi:hypothetical protein